MSLIPSISLYPTVGAVINRITAYYLYSKNLPCAWLVSTRRAPSRHSRDARVYGHTTTNMHQLSTPPLEIQ